MFNKHTLFVIGAGASAPFGFPTGERLLQLITKTVSVKHSEDSGRVINKHDHLVEVLTSEIDSSLVNGLVRLLGEALTPSIDTWLSENPMYMSTGKEAIATLICDAESAVRRHPAESDDWYKWIFQRMLKGCTTVDEFVANPVSFISFNYDRMLEYTLGNAIFTFFGKLNFEEKLKAIEAMYEKIIHVHGVLSFDGFENLRDSFGSINLDATLSQRGHGRQPGITKIMNTARHLAHGIRIIGEPGSNTIEREIASVVHMAQRIVFLGFGYDERNLAILNLRNQVASLHTGPKHRVPPVLGTAYRLRSGQTDDVKDYFNGHIMLDTKLGCRDFCDEYLSNR